ncbi:MAG: flippase-like domain-containing protein [Pseudomonas sp.]|uniref:flippase-like domain-containing protein n=1 Tax=Pseudomonas sp. TaxID=306 RepID=UPI0033964A85
MSLRRRWLPGALATALSIPLALGGSDVWGASAAVSVGPVAGDAGYPHLRAVREAWVSPLLGGSVALLGTALLLVALLGRFYRRLLGVNGRLLARLGIGQSRRQRWIRRVLRFCAALRASLRLPRPLLWGLLLLTAVHWALRYSQLYLALCGLGSALPWSRALLVQVLALSAGQLSLAPGGAGSTELTAVALLAPWLGASTAAAAILIWRLVAFHLYLLAGAPVFVHLVGRVLWQRLGDRRPE